MQVIANQDGGIEEAIGGSGVDQRLDGDWRLAQNEEVDQKRKVTRGGKGEGGLGKGKGAAQPGSYWLGWEFFGWLVAAAAAAAA